MPLIPSIRLLPWWISLQCHSIIVSYYDNNASRWKIKRDRNCDAQTSIHKIALNKFMSLYSLYCNINTSSDFFS